MIVVILSGACVNLSLCGAGAIDAIGIVTPPLSQHWIALKNVPLRPIQPFNYAAFASSATR